MIFRMYLLMGRSMSGLRKPGVDPIDESYGESLLEVFISWSQSPSDASSKSQAAASLLASNGSYGGKVRI